jgi:hypothetical protein
LLIGIEDGEALPPAGQMLRNLLLPRLMSGGIAI